MCKGSVWPTMVDCEDVVKSLCKTTLALLSLAFSALSRRKDSDTMADSNSTELASSSLLPPSLAETEVRKMIFLVLGVLSSA